MLQGGQAVTAVPGLRQSLGNGTLYFPPFRAEDYRKDVHATVYRCRASNLVGTILSRDVHVRAVVNQHYEVQVYHTHVLAGNTAVMGCVIPVSVKEHVTVTSWTRDESILLPGFNMGGRLTVTHGTGELHIRSARAEDGLARYSCLTLHSLTQERKRSAPAILTVTEPTGSMPPRLVPSVQTSVSADQETDVHLTCAAQGNPPPTYEWFRESDGHLQPVSSSGRFEPSQEVLFIRRLRLQDEGRWTCKVSNHFGEQRLDIHLTVTAHLTVHILPQLQVINSGENAFFNCTVSGSPMGRVQWYKNGEPLAIESNNIKLLSSMVLMVERVTRHDRGMYQCMVQNDREMAQGSAELRLGDTVPELQLTFSEQALRPGTQVSLRCSAMGSPPPHFRWFLDGEPLPDLSPTHRYTISQYVDHDGDVISHLNISNLRVEDGGRYTCRAVNSLGSIEHSARINVYGPPFIRTLGPTRAVAGADVTLHCPYSGYPVSPVRWERHDQELPLDLRHKLEDDGSLTISRLDQTADSGFYTCSVSNHEGDVAKRDVQLVVHSPPILEPFSFPTSLQEGGRAQVTCYVTSGDMPIYFSWFKDNEPIPATLQIKERAAEFYSMLIFKEVSSRHSGSYTCVVSNAAAKANYTAQLMVKVAPQWIVEPQDASTLSGNPILLQCSADGFPKPQITWLKAKGLTVGNYQPLISSSGVMELLMNGSLWLLSASPDDEGYYLCRATNGIGSGIGKVIYLGVNEPVRFEIAMKNISVRRGNSATLTCDIHGDTPIQVVWMFNGNRLDPNNYRYTISNLNIEHGLKSQVIIIHADREDSGVYKCLAENVFGHSEHVINLIVQERPDPPNMLEILEVFSRSVRLAWRRPFDGNSPIIGYVVQYQVLNTGQSDHQPVVYNITLPSNSLPNINEPQQRENAVINRLEPATVYTMRMLAVNSIDHSQFTEALVVKTQEEEPSGAPQDVHVEPIGPSELLVSWAIPLRNTWNGELLGYIVSWNEHGASWNRSRKITVKGWATTKVQLTGLKKFTRYDINVCAFNSISSGPPSPTVLATTKEGAPEAPPRDVQCSQISSQSMKISWTPPPPETHAGLIQGYKVYYRPTFNKYIDIPITGEVKRTPSTETYLHGLYKFTNYSIKVLAFTGAGDGVMSNVIYCTTDEDVPGPPAAIKASALTGESILISWLAPVKPNGRITQYTVYSREAGRVGKHITHPVRIEESHSDVDETYGLGLSYEVRGLTEHQLYEFWVSATTGTGEGESTPIVAQATNSRAPSKIASFDQVLHIPVNSKVLLPCLAVGNPTPRTRWIHRDRPVTFSPYYQVTATGHLSIHGIDQNLEGNYTCSAKNLFGEDNITYVLFVITPPSAPNLEVQFATTRSFRLHWTQPDDGGAAIQGYTVNIKHESGDWTSLELSAEHTVYTVDNLRCGSLYHTYIVAHNRVGSGNPSTILSVHTKGGPPSPPRDNDFITTNSTSMNLNLEGWPDGGCPIARFSIHYKILGMKDWMLVSSSYSDKHIIIDDLLPATWYQIQIVAENDAGLSEVLLNFATTTLLGAHILPPPVSFNNTSSNDFIYTEVIIIVSAVLAGILLFILFFWFAVHYFGSRRRTEYSDDADRPHEIHSDKTVERDNQKNCQQVYTSSPIKKNHKIQDDGSGMYEISPYATFSVPGSNSHGRSVTTSTLDYSMHFKTFGHIDDDDLNHRMESDLYPRDVYPKTPNKHSWHKHRYCGSEGLYPKFESPREDLAQNEYIIGQKKMRLCSNHLSNRDSESDDTSGSPCTESAAAGSASAAYHLPVKSSKDLFRPDSSTESYDVSPPLERRQVPGTRTPHHVGPSRRHRPSSSSSEEDEYVKKTSECLSPSPPPPPPSEFLDSREFSEAECDRDLQLSKMSIELTSLISRYQEQKEQERKEFTIFV